MDLKPYSYHTFIFPFNWDNDGLVKRQEFMNALGSMWQESKLKEKESSFWENPEIKNGIEPFENARKHYANYQYFHQPVRDAIYGKFYKDKYQNESVVVNFVFNPKKLKKSYYYIEKEEEIFQLILKGIKLKIFDTGIAIMIFETENLKHRSIKEIKRINDFGRRIIAPILRDHKNGFSMCADVLGVKVDGRILETDYRKFFDKLEKVEDIKENVYLHFIADFIRELLMMEENKEEKKYNITFKKDNNIGKKNIFYIHPIIDDRMFVCCLVRDENFVEKIMGKKETKTADEINNKNRLDILIEEIKKLGNSILPSYEFQRSDEIAKDLYSFLFIDESGSSCQNKEMLQELLKKHVYLRWADSKSFYATTHHSFMCVTGEGPDLDAIVITPFLNMYTQMAILAIVQRGSIINFARKTANCTRGMEKSKDTIKRKKLKEFLKLQKEYASFQNQLLFFEVTPQEQGIELYDMLVGALYIEKEKKHLDCELQSLFEATAVNQDIVFNFWASAFAVGALMLTILTLFAEPSYKLGLLGVVILIIGSFALWIKKIGRIEK